MLERIRSDRICGSASLDQQPPLKSGETAGLSPNHLQKSQAATGIPPCEMTFGM
jgi:hypothetical protein